MINDGTWQVLGDTIHKLFKQPVFSGVARCLCCFLVVFITNSICFLSSSYSQVFTKDNNVWVYSDLFVQRFGMPAQYASAELQGARGIAIRLVPLVRPRCHQTEAGEECVPSYQWLMELYFDLDQDIGITGDSPRQFIPWRSSLYFLGQKNPSLQKHWEEAFGLKGGRLYLMDEKGVRHPVTFAIFSYKRPIEKGLQMIQARIDADVILATPSRKRVMEFENEAGKVVHRVTIPQSYWHRVASYQKEHSEVTRKNLQGGIEKDPNLWVYTREFAEKYHMPLSGVSDEMEGAMAMTFRKDSRGTEACGYFSDSDVCKHNYTMLWGVYLPTDAGLYYADDSIDNLYKGYHISNIFFREKPKHGEIQDTYSYLIGYKGLESGAHIYRFQKKKFFNLLKSKEKTRWYGGPISNHSYLQAQASGGDFVFAEYTDSITMMGVDQYLVFDDDSQKIQLRNLYDSHYHKARIPFDYRVEVLKYVKEFEDKNGSIMKLVEKHFKDKHQGEK